MDPFTVSQPEQAQLRRPRARGVGNQTPRRKGFRLKGTLFELICLEKYPNRAPPYDKNARGVPLHLGVFCPFFCKILVQNGLFIGVHRSNFMGKKRRFRVFFRK
jgi:hypothetical protein